jgi:serine/threonine protein kinase
VADGSGLPELSRGNVIAGTYEIEQKLGAGLLGATYLARNQKTRQQVALKFIKPSLLPSERDHERLDRAFKNAQKIKHDGVVRLLEMGKHQGIAWLAMEYFESQDLRAVMNEYQKEQKPFTIQEACQIAIRILEKCQPWNSLQKLACIAKPHGFSRGRSKPQYAGEIPIESVLMN